MPFEAILRAHHARYPRMQLPDEYKLVHQAALGSEHAVDDPAAARHWLTQEVALLGLGPDEPVFDPISADGQIVRVHLRPYVAGGGDLESLLVAFLRTANEVQGDVPALQESWAAATRVGFYSRSELKTFFDSQAAAGFPAVHHSAVYVEYYRPAYRVVWKEFLLPAGPER